MKPRITFRLAARPLERAWRLAVRWIEQHVIQTVPEEMSTCEYDCQDAQCGPTKWAMCPRRLDQIETVPLRID